MNFKHLKWVAAGLMLAVAGSVYAAEPATQDAGTISVNEYGWSYSAKGVRPAGMGMGPGTAARYIESMDKVVKFSDEQKKTIKDLYDGLDKSRTEFAEKNADKISALEKSILSAMKSKDKEDMDKAQEDRVALFEPLLKVNKEFSDGLQNVFTPEQTAKMETSAAASYVKVMTAPAKLTKEQEADLTQSLLTFNKHLKGAETPRAALERILTAEQVAVIVKSRIVDYVKYKFYAVKLTDEQLKQVDAIAEESAKDFDEVILSEDDYAAVEKKVAGILTDKQAEKMKSVQHPKGDAAMP